MKSISLPIFLVFLCLSTAKQLKIEYSEENPVLHHYFEGLTDQLFVDIGTANQVFELASTAYSSWKGIIVQANVTRLALHHLHNPNSQKLCYAVGDQWKQKISLADYLSLGISLNPASQQVEVISLKSICAAYFTKSPKLLTINIGSQVASILSSNDWKNSLCVPEVIVVPRVASNNQNEVMKKYGYQQGQSTTTKQIYLLRSKAVEYKQKYAKNQEKKYEWRWVSWGLLIRQIGSTIQNGSAQNKSLLNLYPFKIVFAGSEILQVKKIAQRQLKRGASLRPIVIFQYNPSASQIYFGTENFTTLLTPAKRQNLVQFTVNYAFGLQKVYVVDHSLRRLKPVQVIDKEAFDITDSQSQECVEVYNKKTQVSEYLTATPKTYYFKFVRNRKS